MGRWNWWLPQPLARALRVSRRRSSRPPSARKVRLADGSLSTQPEDSTRAASLHAHCAHHRGRARVLAGLLAGLRYALRAAPDAARDRPARRHTGPTGERMLTAEWHFAWRGAGRVDRPHRRDHKRGERPVDFGTTIGFYDPHRRLAARRDRAVKDSRPAVHRLAGRRRDRPRRHFEDDTLDPLDLLGNRGRSGARPDLEPWWAPLTTRACTRMSAEVASAIEQEPAPPRSISDPHLGGRLTKR